MIYLKTGLIPLNLAYDDEITQEANGLYQLTFKFPKSDELSAQLKEETKLVADDLHGEQEFFVFEVKKSLDHVTVYANQVSTLLNSYAIGSISVDRVPAQTVMTALAGSVVRPCPFSFASDVAGRHTLNLSHVSVMDALAKGKHSIIGQWGGDLVRDKYSVRLLANGGTENQSLFMYRKNLSQFEQERSIKDLRTRIHFRKIIKGEGVRDQVLAVTVDSPLIGQYSQIYEATMTVEDQDVTDEASLRAYGQAYYGKMLCDLPEDSMELAVVGEPDTPVRLYDVVSVLYDDYGIDLRLKISKYRYAPMAKRLKSIGFGKVGQTLGGAVGKMVSNQVEEAKAELVDEFDHKLQKELDNANAAFDAEFDKAKQAIEDGIEEAKAAAEVVKAEIGAEVEAVALEGQAVKQAVEAGLAEADSKARAFEEAVRDRVALVETKANQVADQARQSDQKANQALTKAGASETLAQTAKQAADRAKTDAAAALARAEAVKQETIVEAQRLDTVLRTDAENRLATARTELLGKTEQLQTELETTKRSIASQARDILSQAQVQSELTTRLQTVETTANGTRSTVTELSKTLNTATGNLASVTQRVASTEASLAGVRDQYSQLSQTVSGQTGQITAVTRQTADLQRGLNGVTERFEKLKIGGVNLLRNSDFSQGKEHWARLPDVKTEGNTRFVTLPTNLWTMSQSVDVVAGETYTISFYARKRSATGTNPRVSVKFDRHNTETGSIEVTGTDWQRVVLTHQATQSLKETIFFLNRNNVEVDIRHVQVERGNVVTDWSSADEDIRQELATYIRTATENTSRLEQSIQTADGKAEGAKTLAQQTAQGLALKAEKSAVDGLAGRVQSAETSIQVIGGRITTEIAETKALIPTEVGGRNLVRGSAELKQGSRGWAEGHWRTSGSGGSVEYNVTLPSSPIKGVTKGVRISSTDSNQIGLCQDGQSLPPGTYTFSVWVLGSSGLSPHISGAYSQESGNPFSAGSKYANLTDSNWTLVTQTFTLTKRYANISLAYLMLAKPGTVYYAAPYIHASSLVGAWSPATEDMTAELETVKTIITQTSEGQQQLSRRLSETQDKVTTSEAKITQLVGDVGSKVSQIDFDRVKNRVDSQQTAITQNSSAIDLKAEKIFVDGVKTTADSAKAIADGLKTTSATKAELKVVSDGITQLASKTEVDGVTGRLTTAEASIRTQAEQIAQRLTSTQVETAITAKGYQTKAQVDANITGRGYITNDALAGYVPTTTFDSYRTETAQSIERGLTATRSLIPTNFGARNYAEDYDFSRGLWEYSQGDSSVKNWTVSNGIYTVTGTTTTWKQYQIFSESGGRLGGKQDSTALLKLEPGGAYTLSFQARCLTGNPEVWVSLRENRRVSSGGNPERIISRVNLTRDWQTYHVSTKALEISPEFDYWRIILGYTQIGTVQFRRVELTQSNQPMDAGPAPEDMVTSVDFNRVKETAQLYERVIGRSEGDIQTNVARQVLTSQLYQTEVKSPLADLATRVTQLNDSYAIQVLGSSSRILTEINANASGLRLAGKLIHLDGTVTASDAFFRSVLADKIEAGNIKAGAITTAKIAAGAVTADHLLVNQAMIDKLVTNSVWADRLFAQSAFMAKLQATKIQAGQIDAGLIDTAMLAANAVTADKLLVNQAFFNKLMANEAYLRQLFAKQAFITQVQSVELSASRIKSGVLQAINGAMSVNLDSGQILYYTDQAALKRILSGYPTQFIKFATGNVDGKGPAGVTVIGSNRDGSESSNNGGFVGIRAWNGPNVDSLDLVGDEIRLASSAYDSSDGWDVTTLPGRLVIEPHRSVDRTTARIGVGDVRIFYNNTTYVSLVTILDRIFDNFRNLNNNGNYQRNYYDNWK